MRTVPHRLPFYHRHGRLSKGGGASGRLTEVGQTGRQTAGTAGQNLYANHILGPPKPIDNAEAQAHYEATGTGGGP